MVLTVRAGRPDHSLPDIAVHTGEPQRMTVGALLDEPDELDNVFQGLWMEVMLDPARIFLRDCVIHTQQVMQEIEQDLMAPVDTSGSAFTSFGKLHVTVRFVLHQSLVSQAAVHGHHRRHIHLEVVRDVFYPHYPLFLAQHKNCLQVVLGAVGEWARSFRVQISHHE